MTISDYDPELKTRIGLGQSQTVYMQMFTGQLFYLAIFRSHDRPGMVYVESGFAQWHFPYTDLEDMDHERA